MVLAVSIAPSQQSTRFKLGANGLTPRSRQWCHPAAAGRCERREIKRERARAQPEELFIFEAGVEGEMVL